MGIGGLGVFGLGCCDGGGEGREVKRLGFGSEARIGIFFVGVFG